MSLSIKYVYDLSLSLSLSRLLNTLQKFSRFTNSLHIYSCYAFNGKYVDIRDNNLLKISYDRE